jgi:hypothetical protein
MGRKYNLFVSYSKSESNIAVRIKSILLDTFNGYLGKIFFSEDLPPSDIWQESIRIALKNSDAGLFILTPEFLGSPWFIAEFTAFWLTKKPTYVLIIDEDNIDWDKIDKFAPLSSCMIGYWKKREDVKRLILKLFEQRGKTKIDMFNECNMDESGFEAKVEEICCAVDVEYNKASKKRKDRLLNALMKNSDYIQFRYTAGNLMILTDEQLYQVVSQDLISNNDYLYLMIKKMIETNRDLTLINRFIDRLADPILANYAALRKFLIYCVDANMTNEQYFVRAMDGMKNDSEMIKVLYALLDKNIELCLEYYFKRKKPDGKPYLTGERQMEKMEEKLLSRGIDVSAYKNQSVESV